MRALRIQTSRRSVLPHFVLAAMLIALAPHCLFGCSMPMAVPAASSHAIATAMDCCSSTCPMEHSGDCISQDEETSRTVAVAQKTDPVVPEAGVASSPVGPVAVPDAIFTPAIVDGYGPSPPPAVPLHLLNAQFLI